MFSLIVTIIAIVLVAALAIATIYYGGSSFLEGNTRIAAATLLNQGAQIAGSTMLYNEDQQVVPSRPSDLVGQHYLKELPLPPKVAYFGGIEPKRSDWEWFSPSTVHVVLRNKINEKACREVNIKANQTSDIPPIMKPEWIVQCYGLGEPYTFYFDPPGVPQHEREEIARTLSDPLVDVAPDPFDFGTHLVGSQSPSTDIVVSNIGGGVLIVLDMAFNGDFGGYSDCLGSIMWNGQMCTVTTWFEPSAVGIRSGSISIENNSIDNPYTVNLSGRGSLAATPALTFSPNPVQFPDTVQSGSSAPVEVTVTNIGSAPFNITTPSVTGPYSVTHNCPESLPASSVCQLQVTFSPTSSGSHPGFVTLTGNLVAPVGLPLFGAGTSGAPPRPVVTFIPNSLTFPSREIGTTSPTLTTRIVNSGYADFELSSLTTAAPFSLTHNCPNTLGIQDGCDISVTFDPTTVGTINGTIAANGNITSPAFAALSGSSWSGPIISVTPTQVDFGQHVVGSLSALTPVTVTNVGNGSLAISSLAVTGQFSGASNCEGASLTNGQSCQIQAGFQPISVGATTGSIAIANNSPTSLVNVALTGTGSAIPVPSLTLTPTSLNFATRAVGSTSAAQTATLANVGSGTFNLSSTSVSGPFTSTHNCQASLAPGSSCVISVQYVPTLGSATSGSVTVNGNVSSPAVLGLTGSYHSLAVTQNNLNFGTIPLNSSATATVTLTNNGQVGLSGFTANMGGNNAYSVLSNNCTTINIGATCSYTIKFLPTTSGTSNTTITFGTSQGASITAAATGTGEQPAVSTGVGDMELLGTLSHHAVFYVDAANRPWLMMMPGLVYGTQASPWFGNKIPPGIAIGHLPPGDFNYNAITDPLSKVNVTYTDSTINVCGRGATMGYDTPNWTWQPLAYSANVGRTSAPALRDDTLAYPFNCHQPVSSRSSGHSVLWVYNTTSSEMTMFKSVTLSPNDTGVANPLVWGNGRPDESSWQLVIPTAKVERNPYDDITTSVKECSFSHPITCPTTVVSGGRYSNNITHNEGQWGSFNPANPNQHFSFKNWMLHIYDTSNYNVQDRSPVINGWPVDAGIPHMVGGTDLGTPMFRKKDGKLYALVTGRLANGLWDPQGRRFLVSIDPTTLVGDIVASPEQLALMKTWGSLSYYNHQFIGGPDQDLYIIRRWVGAETYRIKLP